VEKDDLALVVSGLPANAAAVFTQNRVQAAPVRLGRSHLKASRGLCGAVVINAGNANCATRTGDAVALATCKAAAKALKLPVTQVVPSSTGVIGVELDARKIVNALPRLVGALSGESFDSVARAIMTTDLVPKTAFAEARLRRGAVRVAGMTKGSGMIQPMMATTLGFVMTDALIPVPQLRAMLKRGVERSYNRISVDGDTSTNDTLLVMANGASGVRPDPKEFAMAEAAITDVMESLAQQIARRGRPKVRHDRDQRSCEQRCGGADRARHCELAAGKNGHRRIRPELGAHPVRGRQCWRGIRSIENRHTHAGCRGV
jgi:glutamate N-acetyltransferase/amino-acid N-acetyltransferase